MKIVLIHGFNVKDNGRGTIDKLGEKLESIIDAEIDKDSADYGFHFLLRVHFFYFVGGTIKRISEALKDADVVITHSNGANYCMKALKKINNPNLHIIHLSPALNRKRKYKEKFKKMSVFHTFNDSIVNLAQYIPFHPWGNAGQVGASHTNHRIKNYNFTNEIEGHSDWFHSRNVGKIADFIKYLIEKSP